MRDSCQACCLPLAAWYPEAWSLQLAAIDHDPGTKLGPSIAHDFELSCDGQQLSRRRVFNLYCKLFHFLLGSRSFFTRRNISSIASAILFNCFVSILFPFIVACGPFCRLSSGPTTIMLKFCLSKLSYLNLSYNIPVSLSSLQLGACGLTLFNFLIFWPSNF